MRGLEKNHTTGHNAGISTVEATILVASIGIFVAFAFLFSANVLGDEAGEKLRSDVRALNASIEVYCLFGGSLEDLTTPEAVLERLKEHSASDSPEVMPDLAGNVVDHRLRLEMQTEEDVASSAPRAVWNRVTQRFEIVHGQVRGVKQFIFEEGLASLAFVPDNRIKASEFSQDESWMWEFESAAPGAAKQYGVAKGENRDTVRKKAPVAVAGARKRLEAPEFSISGGKHPITDFNLGLKLVNPNTAGVSRVYYSVDGGSWMRLNQNGGIRVQPDTKIAAYCKSIDDRWADSEETASLYGATPVTLDPPRVQVSSMRFDFDNNRVVRVKLENTNAARSSKLEYRVNGSDWRAYEKTIELEGKGFIEDDARIQVRSRAVANFFYDSVVTEARIARPGSSETIPNQGESIDLSAPANGGGRSGVPAPAGKPNFAAAALGGAL